MASISSPLSVAQYPLNKPFSPIFEEQYSTFKFKFVRPCPDYSPAYTNLGTQVAQAFGNIEFDIHKNPQKPPLGSSVRKSYTIIRRTATSEEAKARTSSTSASSSSSSSLSLSSSSLIAHIRKGI